MKDIIEEAAPDERQAPGEQSLADMQAAFKRAAELRDTPYAACKIKPRRGNKVVHPYVLATNEKRGSLVKVLIPYNEIETRNAKDKFFVTQENPRPHMRRGMHVPVRMHEQWVNEDRLQRIA